MARTRPRGTSTYETVNQVYVGLYVLERQLETGQLQPGSPRWSEYESLIQATNELLGRMERAEGISNNSTAEAIRSIRERIDTTFPGAEKDQNIGEVTKTEKATTEEEKVIEEINQEEPEVVTPPTGEPDLGSRSLNKAELDALIEAYEKHLAEAGGDSNKANSRTAGEFHTSQYEVQRIIQRKLEIQAEIEAKLKTKEGIDPRKAEAIARELAQKETVVEEELRKTGSDKFEEIRAKTEDGLIEAVVNDDPKVIEKVSKEARSALKEAGVDNVELVNLTEESFIEGVATAKVEVEVEQMTEKVVSSLEEKLSVGEREILRQEIEGIFVDEQTNTSEVIDRLRVKGIEVQKASTQIAEAVKTVEIMRGRTDLVVQVAGASLEENNVVAILTQDNLNPSSTAEVINNQTQAIFRFADANKAQRLIESGTNVNLPKVMTEAVLPEQFNGDIGQLNVSTGAVEDKARTAIQLVKRFGARADISKRFSEAVEQLDKGGVVKTHRLLERAQTVNTYYRRITDIIYNNPLYKTTFELARKGAAIENMFTSKIALAGIRSVGVVGIARIAGVSTEKFAVLATREMLRFGTEAGLFRAAAVVARAGSWAATSGVKKVALSGLSKILVQLSGTAAGPPGWVAAAVLFVIDLVGDKVVGAINWVNKTFGFGLSEGLQRGIKGTIGKIPLLGKPVATVINIGIGLFELFMTLVAGSLLAPIAIVIVCLFLGMGIMQMMTGGMVSSLVPPSGLGGGQKVQVGEAPPNGWQTTPIPLPDWNGGPIAEGCPNGVPVNGGRMTQGPFAPSCSHQNMSSPAIDIGIAGGTPIHATHDGLATSHWMANGYGYYVTIEAKCDNRVFRTLYGHMYSMPFPEGSKKQVKAGDIIGIVDNTGNSTGNHLHYEANLPAATLLRSLGFDYSKAQQAYQCCIGNGKACPSL